MDASPILSRTIPCLSLIYLILPWSLLFWYTTLSKAFLAYIMACCSYYLIYLWVNNKLHLKFSVTSIFRLSSISFLIIIPHLITIAFHFMITTCPTTWTQVIWGSFTGDQFLPDFCYFYIKTILLFGFEIIKTLDVSRVRVLYKKRQKFII